jgi:hypothetical protein
MLSVSKEVVLKELETAKAYLAKWEQRLEEGIPEIDFPATGNSSNALEDFLRELCGELRVVSGKCDTLAEVLMDSLTSG